MLDHFMLTGLLATSKVKIREHCIRVTAVMAEHDWRPTDISCVFNFPKADVLLATRNKA